MHDSGVHEDQPYLVLELLRGETLDARLARGPLPPLEALRVTVGVCRALVHAHAARVLHGDLSLTNVMVLEDGTVKVLDLGLSRLIAFNDLRGGGTPGFIAPEKLLGEIADARSEVFSTGVLLFCLLRGERSPPRREPLSSALADEARRSLPRALGAIVARALDPEPARRQQSARALLDALKHELRSPKVPARLKLVALVLAAGLLVGLAFVARGVAPRDAPPSVAVLPFLDLSAPQDQRYFADGIAEEIRGALARVEGLRVIGRTSSLAVKQSEDLRGAAQALGVSSFLEGSVREEGNRVRITARLVAAADGANLWSQSFDRELSSVLAVQEEIAQSVVAALRIRLLPGRQLTATAQQTASPEAYNQFLLGRRFAERGGPQEARLVAAAFERALLLDPGYAPAWAGLSTATFDVEIGSGNAADLPESRRKVIEAAEKAVALGPDLPEAYVARSVPRILVTRDWAGARSDLERALALNPGSSTAWMRYAQLLAELGSLGRSIGAATKATELDPLSAQAFWVLANSQLRDGRLVQAEATAPRALGVSPDHVRAQRDLGFALLLQGRLPEALATFAHSREEIWRLTGTAVTEHALGHMRESQAALDALISRSANAAAYQVAQVFAWRGDRDRAFEWLDKAYAGFDPGLNYLKNDPLLARLRADPRYAALVGKLKLPPD